MKLFYFAVISLSLSGCASTPGTTCFSTNPISPYAFITTEVTKSELAGFEKSTEYLTEDTSGKKEFYAATPVKVFSGIESANIDNSKLSLALLDRGLFEQYSAPVENVIQKTYYNAHPTRVVFGTIFSAGLIWLIAPTKASHLAFGCTELLPVGTKPNEVLKVKTGKFDWQPIQKSHKIRVSGFDKDYEFAVDADTSPKVIDLSSAISNTELTKNTNLRITCLDCDLLEPEAQTLYKDSKASVQLSYNFREVKKSLLEEQQLDRKNEAYTAKLSECHVDSDCQAGFSCRAKDGGGTACKSSDSEGNTGLQRHDIPASPTQDSNSVSARTQPILTRTSIEEAKQKCAELGYKERTEKFGNCVLKLSR